MKIDMYKKFIKYNIQQKDIDRSIYRLNQNSFKFF